MSLVSSLLVIICSLHVLGNPNVQSSEGLTPLHIAAIWGRREALNLLLEHGADATIPDGDGKTALDWAREESGDACSIKLLEEAIKAQLKSIRTNSRNSSLTDRFGPWSG